LIEGNTEPPELLYTIVIKMLVLVLEDDENEEEDLEGN
jgi:hypothetical protein